MQDFEKLGVFYLGRRYDLARHAAEEDLILYDSRDLLTHAVCVGMTGSGKTGLCLTLLEEAAIDGIPAIVIDPKGDLTNLLLTFPQLAPEDFRPWVHEEDAQRKNISVDELAREQAELWKKGLADSGQDGARIERLRQAADFAVYTPGSSAGRSISILRAFAPPQGKGSDDEELLRERVNATVTGLLAMIGLSANPLESREHILLATILEQAWREGRSLDLGSLIQQTQQPPLEKVGVVDLESFFPAKERFALAMRLNNLLSAPSFQSWLQGEPLDIGALLHSATGKPRISIFSIAHLDDAQRMFFVALLLNETLSWMRSQSGATSLRAILFMDEIFGYFPPVANPPSKTPLLMLLKQARAFGIGIVLATQNPVDLDYKGLSNCGTWFLGRLQTERDKARVMDGLQGAAAAAGAKFDRARIEEILSGLKNRVFLMNNVHEDAPVVFQARWAMSYLCGPLGRDQLKKLTGTTAEPTASAAAAATQPTQAGTPTGTHPTASPRPGSIASGMAPVLPPAITQVYLPVRGSQPAGAQLVYEPAVLGLATVHFLDKKLAIDVTRPHGWLAEFSTATGTIDWQAARAVEIAEEDLERTPAEQATYAAPPASAVTAKAAGSWQKTFADALYRLTKVDLLRSPSLSLVSQPNETERDFRVRLQLAGREERDQLVEKLRQKYAPKQASLEERIRRAEQSVAREKSQAHESMLQSVISAGSTVVNILLSRKKLSATTINKAQTAARGVGRSMKQSSDVGRAEETVESLRAQQEQLAAELLEETTALQNKIDPLTETLESVLVRPRKSDVAVRLVALAWLPSWQMADGTLQSAWE